MCALQDDGGEPLLRIPFRQWKPAPASVLRGVGTVLGCPPL